MVLSSRILLVITVLTTITLFSPFEFSSLALSASHRHLNIPTLLISPLPPSVSIAPASFMISASTDCANVSCATTAFSAACCFSIRASSWARLMRQTSRSAWRLLSNVRPALPPLPYPHCMLGRLIVLPEGQQYKPSLFPVVFKDLLRRRTKVLYFSCMFDEGRGRGTSAQLESIESGLCFFYRVSRGKWGDGRGRGRGGGYNRR
jgi:hypothetical protein